MFPRGGGIWDQDPILIRDFRLVRKFAKDWEHDQAAIADSEQRLKESTAVSLPQEGQGPKGVAGLDAAMNKFLDHLEEDGGF